jgi:hypothetical protein
MVDGFSRRLGFSTLYYQSSKFHAIWKYTLSFRMLAALAIGGRAQL